MIDSLWRRLRAFGGESPASASERIPDAIWAALQEALPVLDGLDANEAARLRALVAGFLAEKRIEGAGGQSLDDADRALIATLACLPILGLGLDAYRGWRTVIVHPDEFVVPEHEIDESGIAHEWEEARAGEAWERGPVVLSWADIESSGQGAGYNVIIHEMAHKLDMLNGDTNGFPPLHPHMDPRRWSDVFTKAYDDLVRRVDAGRPCPIDDYAATSPGEFFAVASEYFFEWPEAIRDAWPGVYRELAEFYRQDPLRRPRRPDAPPDGEAAR